MEKSPSLETNSHYASQKISYLSQNPTIHAVLPRAHNWSHS